MKKIAIMLLAASLVYWVQKSALKALKHPPAAIIHEATFIRVVRDLELLNSWLLNSYYPQETIDILRYQNHQKILASYKVDPKTFEESLKYYLEDARALKTYKKVYRSLEALSA